jgi:UDP-N-acetylmuramoyl-L-alanyl-D-glutamate--2,6-diaminopimelate ligase
MSTAITAITGRLHELGLLVSERGTLPPRIESVTDDSRAANAATLFVAVPGSVRDGHDYLPAVEAQGTPAAIVEDPSRTRMPVIVVRDARRAAAAAAAVVNGDPARRLEIVGVTGTNGKTTTVGLLRHLLDGPGTRAASIGTLGILVGSAGEALEGGSGLTTPGPIELQRVLAALVARGVTRVAMEVSSHSLHQHRVEGIVFAAGVFTNLTRDHLDYHGTMESYLAAKALLVGLLAPDGTAVVNADDDAWKSLPAAPRRLTFSAEGRDADVRALDVAYRPRGSEWTLASGSERAPVKLPLIGAFNVANALAAASAAIAVGLEVTTIAERLSRAPQVPGRLELLHDAPAVLRDYAHTPDALERALDAVRPFATRRLIVVFGAGGDRDKGKRPVMGDIATRKADIAIVTSDNPRTEDPERILDDIEAGMHGRAHERVEDRRSAIARALALAGDDDVVVLAGKGHETYQIRGTVKHHFDEKEIVDELTSAKR